MLRMYTTWTISAALLLAAGLQILTDTLPQATAGVFYNQAIAAAGGSCPTNGPSDFASSSIDSGTLPPGLSVISQGVRSWSIQGTPNTPGTYQFVLHVRWTHLGVSPFTPDCIDEATKALSISVAGTPIVPLTVSRNQVSTTYRLAHFPPAPESVQVSLSQSASVAFTTRVTTNAGGSWLSVTPTTGTTPTTISLQFAVSGLAAGVYTGTVTLSTGGVPQASIAVTLTVVADSNLVLRATPSSLTFSAVAGGSAPAVQPVQVTAGNEVVLFTSTISAPPTGKWLAMSPGGAATPASVNVSVDPKGLAPGTYSGTITLQLAGLSSVAQTIPVNLTVTATPTQPTISANGVLNAGSLVGAIAPGAWVSIFGANLSPTTRSWRDSDFVGGKLPSSLDNVSVTIDGRPAAVSYVSQTQINALAPDNLTTGLVFVQVKTPVGTSDPVLVLHQTASPAFFQFHAPSANYVAATHASGAILAGATLVQQGILGTPAKPGETIVLYGTGFGVTQPPIPATSLVTSALPLANQQDLRVRIGGVDAQAAFAGLVAPGLYQFNVVVPNVPDGDQLVTAELRGLATQAGLLVSIQR